MLVNTIYTNEVVPNMVYERSADIKSAYKHDRGVAMDVSRINVSPMLDQVGYHSDVA